MMNATGGQAQTLFCGLVSVLASKEVDKIESSKNAAGERAYKIAKWSAARSSNAASDCKPRPGVTAC
jgi:hypothetical protein